MVQQQQPEVIVIGAGCAGLAAAVALTARGRRVLVLEARGRLGGRASAYFDKVTGESVDNGQHVLAGCYDHTFALLDAIGARDRVYLQRSLEVGFVDERGKSSVLKCPEWRSPWHLAGGVLRWRALSWGDRIALLKFGRILPKLPAGVKSNETVEEWLVRHGQTPRLRKMLWEPLALAALNQDAKVAAALPFAQVLKSMFGGGPRRAALGLPVVPLEQLFGEPARDYIVRNGGEVRMHSLARVVVRHGRIGSVDIRGESLQAKQVICAVPWFGVANAIQDDEQARLKPMMTAAAAMTPSPIVTVNVWFDRPVLSRPFVGLPGRVAQWAFDTRLLWKITGRKMPEPAKPGDAKDGAGAVASAPGDAAAGAGAGAGDAAAGGSEPIVELVPHLSLVSSGADAVLRYSNEQIVEQALTDLRNAVPAAAFAKVVRATVVREPYATFSVALGQPSRPQPRTPIEGLWLAGDWTDTGLPGTIEGAVLSGHRAAEAADDAIEAARQRDLRDQEERKQRPAKPKAKAPRSALHSPVGDNRTSPEAQRTSEHEHGVEHEKL